MPRGPCHEYHPRCAPPMPRVHGLGAAKSGTEHFWLPARHGRRNIPLTIGLVVIVIMLEGRSIARDRHPVASARGAGPSRGVYSAAVHMRLGMAGDHRGLSA